MPIYSDINQYEVATKFKLYDIEAIYQSIHNILATKKTERIFEPEFGSVIDDLLFEPMDDITAQRLLSFIIDAIDEWEPRVTIDYSRSTVTPDYDNNKYDVILAFVVKGLEDETFQFEGLITR